MTAPVLLPPVSAEVADLLRQLAVEAFAAGRAGAGDSLAALTPKRPRPVAVNERGNRLGEDHHRSKLSNAQVNELCRRWDTRGPGVTRATLAAEYGVSVHTIKDIVLARRRCSTPDRYVSRFKGIGEVPLHCELPGA